MLAAQYASFADSSGSVVYVLLQALLDVAVFELPPDAALVDAEGVATVRPTPLRSAAEDETVMVDDGPTLRLGRGQYCVDEAAARDGADGAALVVKACLSSAEATRAKVCRRYGCFRKCCAHHEHFALSHGCVPRPAPPEGTPLRPQVGPGWVFGELNPACRRLQ